MQSERLIPILERLRTQRDDPDAWEDLYHQLWPWLLWHAQKDLQCKNVADAEDLSQDVFLRLMESADFLRIGSRPNTLLGFARRIGKNSAIDRLRATSKRNISLNDFEEIPAPARVNPCTSVDLAQAFTTVTSKEAELLALLAEGRSSSEIAKKLNITKESTYNIVSQLRSVLRGLLGRSKH